MPETAFQSKEFMFDRCLAVTMCFSCFYWPAAAGHAYFGYIYNVIEYLLLLHGSSLFEPVLVIHWAALDLGIDFEQLFDCLIVQNRQAVHSTQGGRWIGQWRTTWSPACFSAPHSQAAERAVPLYGSDMAKHSPCQMTLRTKLFRPG